MKKQFKLFTQANDRTPFKYVCTARKKTCKCQFAKWFRAHEMKRLSCPETGDRFMVEAVRVK